MSHEFAARVYVQGQDCPGLDWLEWEAHPGGRVLGVFWCKALGEDAVLTTNVSGEIRWWELPLGTGSGCCLGEAAYPRMISMCRSPFHKRIWCADLNPTSRVLVAGDQKGNVMVFRQVRAQHPSMQVGA